MIDEPSSDYIEPINPRKLVCSIHNRMLFGVCGGLAQYFKINSAVIRLIAIILFFPFGLGAMIYIILAFVIPTQRGDSELPPFEEKLIRYEKKLFTGWFFISAGIVILLNNISTISLINFSRFFENKFFPFLLIALGLLLFTKDNKLTEEVMNSTEPKKLTLSNDKKIFGICGGIAEYLNVDPTIVRILWVVFLFASFGMALILYIVLKFIIPPKENTIGS